MAKFCTNCGKELNENAAICLNCGVLIENNNQNTRNNTKNEQKKGMPTWAIVLIIVGAVVILPVIIFVLIFVFTFNAVNNTIDNLEDYNEESIVDYGTIGDTLYTDDFKITLKDSLIYSSIGTDGNYLDIPSVGKEYLVFFFEVENISDSSEYISDYDFAGYVDGYQVDVEYLYNDINGISDLDATLLPNKKTKGYVAFEVDTSWEEFEIHYEEWFNEEKLIFTVVNEDNTNVTGA